MKKVFIILISIFSCVIFIMGALLISTSNSLTSATANLENLYQRSFYNLVDNVNTMESDISKLMVSNDSISQQKILSSIKQRSSDAESDLSLLPVNNNLLEKTSKFMNQLNGYCTSLISYRDGKLENADFDSLNKVYNSIAAVKKELNAVMDKIMHGYRITENAAGGETLNDFSNSLSKLSNESISYPALIYDGPFSDSVSAKQIKGLKGNVVSENDAENIITKLFENKITNLSYLGETKGRFETYDFGVNTDAGRNYFIQITKQGGFLLTMSSNILDGKIVDTQEEDLSQTKSENEKINESDALLEKNENSNNENGVKIDQPDSQSLKSKNAQSVAENFAIKLGLNNLKCVWSASSQDVCYVNLAPVVDDIIMYPDLIKVKIDLNADSILGWEASNYAYNHTEREDLVATLTEDEAKNLVSSNLKIDDIKLCVIPLDYVGETLAYEFSGTYGNFNYYLYIDAYTGSQVRVLRVIQTDQGELVL